MPKHHDDGAVTACPVCRAAATHPFLTVGAKAYHRCPTCEAIFLDPAHRLDRKAEHAHYLTHRNDPADAGYRRFLARLAAPLLARLAPESDILDFGSGPGPALAAMLAEAGHCVRCYDPFFAPDRSPLEARYDAVTCTEVIEHLHDPAAAFDSLVGLVRPGGWLALMTCFQTDDARFANWHYRRDATHVVFYKEATLRWLATARGLEIEVPVKDVALLRKPA